MLRRLATQTLVGIAYAAAGKLCLLGAAPGGLVCPLFLPAGIALASLLVVGTEASVGVWLGAFVLYGAIAGPLGEPLSSGLLLPAALATAAMLQALLGRWLFLRYGSAQATSLDTAHDIVVFLALGVVVPSAVDASIASAAVLVHAHALGHPLSALWWNWLISDVMGAIAGAPITLAFCGRPRSAWRSRRMPVAVPLLFAVALLTAGSVQIRQWERQRHESALAHDAAMAGRTVESRIERNLDAVRAVASLYEAEPDVSDSAFARAVAPWLRLLPSLHALGWAQHVDRALLLQRQATRSPADAQVPTVFDRVPAMVKADPDVIFVRLAQPPARNREALGVNVLSQPASRLAALEAANGTEPVASPSLPLLQDGGGYRGVVVYQGIHDAGTAVDRAHLRGLAFATLRLDQALAEVTSDWPARFVPCLYDDADRQLLAGGLACQGGSRARRADERAFRFAGRPWRLAVMVLPRAHPAGLRPSLDSGAAWLFAAGGTLSTVLLSALLLYLTGRTRLTEVAVRMRTAELRREVAERRVTEQALRETEQRFRTIFHAVPVGVVYTDLLGGIRLTNTRFQALVGYGADQLASMSVLDLTHPDDRDEDLRLWQRLQFGESAARQYVRQKRYHRIDGKELEVVVTVRVLEDEVGKPYGLVGLVENLRDRMRFEEMQRALRRAESANEEKSRFLANMSHELRTPLNAVLGFAQLMSLDNSHSARLTGRQHDWLERIKDAGWHLLRMIDDILDLSRIESGHLPMDLQPVPVMPLLRACAHMIEAQAAEQRVRVLWGEGLDDKACVLADSTRLRQIVLNLLSNAVKYNRPQGKVRISAVQGSDGRLQLRIADSGLGMTSEQLAHLFEPFNRLGREHGSTPGTGIGLVISRLLAQRMGGTLEVTSVPDRGTTFSLALPAAAGPSAAISAGGTSSATYHQRELVLIEDNRANADVIDGLLRLRPQIRVRAFERAEPALHEIEQHPPDLVLLDLGLPDLDGLEVLQRLKAGGATSRIPVLVVSASAMPDDVERALVSGACGFIPKPIVAETFYSTIDAVLADERTGFDDLVDS
jgi:PAS domain S-box-containing protein